MKKHIAVLLVIVLSILSACGQNNSNSADAMAEEDGAIAEVDAISRATESTEQEGTGSPVIVRDGDMSGIYTRTTTRSFSEEPVSDEQIAALIQAAFTSPTGGNQRAWEFIVVTDSAVMAEIQTGHPYAGALDTAPLVMIVAANESNARYPELLEFDSGIATQSILIQASELGLSTVAMSISPQEERIQAASSAIGLPENVIPHMMIAIGYPTVDAVSSASVDYYDAGKVHYNQYA